MKKKYKKIYLISAKERSLLIADMKREFDRQGVPYEQIDPEYLVFDATSDDYQLRFFYKGRELDFCDSYVFISNRTRNKLIISLLISSLNHYGVEHSAPIYEHVTQTEDKHYQVVKLFLNKIPVAKTIVASASAFLRNRDFFQDRFPGDFVLKAAGSRGDYVWKLSSVDEVDACLDGLSSEQKKILSFQYLIEGAEFDVRALFFKSTCISAMKRQGEGFLNNHSKGARVEKYELSVEEQGICEQASAISGLDFLGIDYMIGAKGPVILELQNSPYMRGMRSTNPELNIGARIAQSILSQDDELRKD